ncbi:MAG: PRC-barrel domain-containing protein [Chloroflexi bacterium]|nr:PRC-barrel domain-containing protein [Chloroflexota bacterium]
MEFKQHVGVFTVDDQAIGRLERVVIDPGTTEITHLIVRRGLLTPHDKVIPIDRVEVGAENGLIVRLTADDVEHLPDFEETQYVAADEERLERTGQIVPTPAVPILYWLPVYPRSPLLPQFVDPGYRIETQLNIPEGTVAVKEGARVIARDGKRAGNIDEVVTTGNGDRITHVLISQGLLVKEKKLIPAGWIAALGEDEVHLAVGSRTIAKLPNYDQA